MDNKCEVYDIIISFVKSYKNDWSKHNHPFIESSFKDKKTWIWNCDYLLNQILRHIDIPPERYYVSKLAYEKWRQISRDDIENYYDGHMVTCEFDNVEIVEYKGNSKKPLPPRIINKGDTFKFNQVFLLEHMIPISMVIEELKKLPDDKLDYSHVDNILSKRYVCRILKREDNKITHKYNRSLDIEEVLRTDYKDIEVIRK